MFAPNLTKMRLRVVGSFQYAGWNLQGTYMSEIDAVEVSKIGASEK